MSDQLRNQLNKYKKKNGINTPNPKKKRKKKSKTENFSRNEIEDLMGTNRPTYSRGPGGAIRQK